MTILHHEGDLGAGPGEVPPVTLPTGREPTKRRHFEFLYFAVRNTKLIVGLSLVLAMILIAVIGPLFVKYPYGLYTLPKFHPPSSQYYLGTNYFGNDVFSEFVYGLRESLFVGLLAGCGATVIGMTFGFIAGYKGGLIDEALNVLTNVLLTLPTLVLLILVAGFLKHTSALYRSPVDRVHDLDLGNARHPGTDFLSGLAGLCRACQALGRKDQVDHPPRDRAQHEFVSFLGVHLVVWQLDPYRGRPRLSWPRTSRRYVPRHHDEPGQRLERSSAAPVVVVHPTRSRHHLHRRGPLSGQCRTRRGIQPQAAGAIDRGP